MENSGVITGCKEYDMATTIYCSKHGTVRLRPLEKEVCPLCQKEARKAMAGIIKKRIAENQKLYEIPTGGMNQ